MPIIYTENGVIKSPKHPRYIYTKNEVDEIKKCSKSLVYFAEICISPEKLTSKQKEVLEAYENKRFVILKCTEQFDKTLLSILYALWYSIFNYYKDVAILSDTTDNAKTIANRCKNIYENLPIHFKLGIREYNTFSIDFDNNSKIMFRKSNQNALCGYTVNLLIADEYLEEKDDEKDGVFIRNFPSIFYGAEKGNMVLISTKPPYAKVFNDIWNKKVYIVDDNFKHLEITEEGK